MGRYRPAFSTLRGGGAIASSVQQQNLIAHCGQNARRFVRPPSLFLLVQYGEVKALQLTATSCTEWFRGLSGGGGSRNHRALLALPSGGDIVDAGMIHG